MLLFDNVTMAFSDQMVFENLSFQVQPGQSMVITGPSGRGKSTIFQLIMGFEEPVFGSISVGPESIAGSSASKQAVKRARANMAYLPQEFGQFQGTVREFIDRIFHFRMNRHLKPKPEILCDHLEQLCLETSILEKYMDNVSGGEKQRIGIILCRLLQRQFILLDEPTSALDDASSALIFDYVHQPGVVLLSISHDRSWIQRCQLRLEL